MARLVLIGFFSTWANVTVPFPFAVGGFAVLLLPLLDRSDPLVGRKTTTSASALLLCCQTTEGGILSFLMAR